MASRANRSTAGTVAPGVATPTAQRAGLKEWLIERLALRSLTYEVPEHANRLGYLLGGATAAGMVIVILTGILLAQFYNPSADQANHSVRALTSGVFAGGFLRSLHVWGAQLTVFTLLLHLLRVLFYGSYRRPREANWIVGVLLFSAVMGFFFTGTVLKWDQESYEALAHNAEIAEILGRLGAWFSPAFSQTTPILTRLYMAHVSILPLLFALLLGIHLFLVKQHGISPLPWANRKETGGRGLAGDRRGHPGDPSRGPVTFAMHLKKLSGYVYILLGTLVLLAVLVPAGIGPEPVEGIEVTKPPWPFLPIFAAENWFGIKGLLWAVVGLEAALLAVPFIDRGKSAHWRDRKGVVAASALVLVAAIALGLYAYWVPPATHIGM